MNKENYREREKLRMKQNHKETKEKLKKYDKLRHFLSQTAPELLYTSDSLYDQDALNITSTEPLHPFPMYTGSLDNTTPSPIPPLSITLIDHATMISQGSYDPTTWCTTSTNNISSPPSMTSANEKPLLLLTSLLSLPPVKLSTTALNPSPPPPSTSSLLDTKTLTSNTMDSIFNDLDTTLDLNFDFLDE